VRASFGNQPSYSEGFVVRFFKKDGTSWIGNFGSGSSKVMGIYPLTNKDEVLVFAYGTAYILNIESQKLLKSFGYNYDQLIHTSDGVMILSDFTNITTVAANGGVWHSERISWDGIKDLKLEGNIVSGLSYNPMNKNMEWVPFSLDLKTKELKGGSYNKYEFDPISENVSRMKRKPWWKNLLEFLK
jgi:hypothetical protein